MYDVTSFNLKYGLQEWISSLISNTYFTHIVPSRLTYSNLRNKLGHEQNI